MVSARARPAERGGKVGNGGKRNDGKIPVQSVSETSKNLMKTMIVKNCEIEELLVDLEMQFYYLLVVLAILK